MLSSKGVPEAGEVMEPEKPFCFYVAGNKKGHYQRLYDKLDTKKNSYFEVSESKHGTYVCTSDDFVFWKLLQMTKEKELIFHSPDTPFHVVLDSVPRGFPTLEIKLALQDEGYMAFKIPHREKSSECIKIYFAHRSDAQQLVTEGFAVAGVLHLFAFWAHTNYSLRSLKGSQEECKYTINPLIRRKIQSIETIHENIKRLSSLEDQKDLLNQMDSSSAHTIFEMSELNALSPKAEKLEQKSEPNTKDKITPIILESSVEMKPKKTKKKKHSCLSFWFYHHKKRDTTTVKK